MMIDEYPEGGALRCYQDDGFLLYSTSISSSCEYIATNINKNTLINNINIYPNPATETLTMELTDNKSKEQVQIFNSIGVLIKEIEITETVQINIADLPNGLYFIRLKNQLKQTREFIKQ